ncbi:MFS transporter [Kitasatospora sp. CM 4170]|uniref:MFS transporter n=1 Tax=Kitasatospora aburaviensis TaxID=67265 RepID=A0ABW1F532_9ACTN|nr:MFS transporter [Kitasatospora sp. CM 4170]WNM49848.1 MFS transporter [Kitasatospora sp. CM 4170]
MAIDLTKRDAAAAPTGERGGRRRSRVGPLRHRDFRRLWLGAGLSGLGSQLTALAMPLWILDRTGSPALAGLVATMRLVALFAAQLPAGALADRRRRRTILIAADAGRAAAVAALGLLVLSGQDAGRGPVLLAGALATVEGLLTSVAMPAGMAALPRLVPRRELDAAVAFGQGQAYAVQFLGPLLGAALYRLQPAVPFLLDGLSYVVSLGLVLTVRRSLGGGDSDGGSRGESNGDSRGDSGSGGGLRAAVADGLRYVVGSRYLRALLAWSALVNFATAGIAFVLVVVAGRDRPQSLGVALAVTAVAGVVGALLAPRFPRVSDARLLRVVTAMIVAAAAGAALRPSPVVMTLCTAAIALVSPAVVVRTNTRVLALVPDALMGRVQGSLFLVGGCLYPFATVVTGWLDERFSAGGAMAAHTVVLAVVLALTFLPGLRRPPPPDAGR